MPKHIERFVYAYNAKEALSECRLQNPNLIPVKAKYSGTKHGFRTYLVYCKNRRI